MHFLGHLSWGDEPPMQDIVVVGASAGGVEALQVLTAGLVTDLPASVFVVLHIGRGIDGRSFLPEILARAGALPVKHPVEGEEICRAQIYVAPPDCHMLLRFGHVHVLHGPKENRTRPSINPLFRSAAAAYGPRVTGVILTGLLDDGVGGLAEIERRGGLAVVQDPATALYPSMPENALKCVNVDHVVPLHGIAQLVHALATTERDATEVEEPMERKLVDLTCPECRGPIWEERQGRIVQYRCRVGHAYSPLTFLKDYQDTVERTLWSTAVALEEAANISEKLAPELGTEAAEDARKRRAQLAAIKEMLSNAGQ
jgi:two-component system, chemotaxis family, protein-glutamate methylesterase/glutaminase